MTFDPFKPGQMDPEELESLREAIRQAGIDMQKYPPYKEKKMERVYEEKKMARVYEVGARVTYYFPGDDEHGVAGTVIGFRDDPDEVRYQIKWDKGPGSVEPEAYLRREQKKPEFKDGDRVRLRDISDGLPLHLKGRVGTVVGDGPDPMEPPGLGRLSVHLDENGSHTRDGKRCWFVSVPNLELVVEKKKLERKLLEVGARVVRTGPHVVAGRDYGESESKFGEYGTVDARMRDNGATLYGVRWDNGHHSTVNAEAICTFEAYFTGDFERYLPTPEKKTGKTMLSVPKEDWDQAIEDQAQLVLKNQELKESLEIAREAIAQARRERDAVVATLAAMKARGFDKILADMEEEEQVIPS